MASYASRETTKIIIIFTSEKIYYESLEYSKSKTIY